MIARLATLEEIPELLQRVKDSGGVFVDMYHTPVWVAVDNGKIVGLLAATPIYQLEPLLVFSDNKITSSRAGVALYRAAEKWIAGTGAHWILSVTRSKAVMSWAKRLGWHRQYDGAALYIKKP